MMILAWLLAALEPAHAAEAARRYALLVGANDGGADRATLRYAHSDAQSVGQVLTELGGLDSSDRTLLFDPSRDDLQAALDDLGARVASSSERAEVFFYYSGHSNEQGLLLGGESFPYRELRTALEDVSAVVQVAILDSCSSGAMIRTKGGRRVPPFLVDDSNDVGGFAYITSSAADEVSQEADQIGGSFFTHSLATGLRGAADQSGDGRVTLDEAYAFAYSTTLARTERSQYGPQHAHHFKRLSGKGNLVLTDLHLTSASLVLDEGLEGRALVRDEDGDLVAELVKPAGRMIELGLGPGDYEITFGKLSDGRFALAQVNLEIGTTEIVTADDLVWYEAESAVARGDGPADDALGEAPEAEVTVITDVGKRGPPRLQLVPGIPRRNDRYASDTLIIGVVTQSRAVDGLALALGGSLVDDSLDGINLALGTSIVGGNLNGYQGTLGFNLVRGDVRGLQATLGGNVAGGDVNGFQLSLGGNWARRTVDGGQFSLGINSADRGLRGLQLTLGGNLSVGETRGIQGSLGANLSTRELNGAQVTLGANVVTNDAKGLQSSLGANVAGDVDGVQTTLGVNLARELGGLQAGGINVARDVRGAQIGFINVGREVRGLQLGLVNVARKVDGVAIGLLTFEKEGRHDLLAYASETDWLNLEFKLGGRYFHTIFGAGGMPGDYAWAGLGYGAHIPIRRLWLDIDGLAQTYVQPSDFRAETGGFRWPSSGTTLVTRGRLTLGAQIAKQFAVFGGVSIAVQPNLSSDPVGVARESFLDDSLRVALWPGAFAGVQF